MNAKSLPAVRVHSLRSRVTSLSVLVSILIIIVILFGYVNLTSARKQAIDHLSHRDELLVMISDVRGSLLNSYKDLNNFLLVPDSQVYQDNILNNINHSLVVANKISVHELTLGYHKQETAEALSRELITLKKKITQLIKIRLDPNTQFPSLQVGADVMHPNRNNMNNAIALAVNEMRSDNAQIEQPKAYSYLMQSRHLWTQVLSNFRLYLANRVGSFNEQALSIQEWGISTLYAQLKVELEKLQALADNDELGFETSDAVEKMQESSRLWFGGFTRVKEIHQSDEWRNDAKLMKQSIGPAIDHCIDTLIELESINKKSARDDVALLDQLGRKQNVLLAILALMCFAFIGIMMFSLNKLVFKPIHHVSEALKSEALGKKSRINLLVHSRETHDLINAFSEMSHQVHVRQEELEFRALHDSLTSLANRTLLHDRIEHQIARSKRNNSCLSLLVIDLDKFKEVNDTLGHVSGDSLLIKVGEAIKSTVRELDTVARFGGDEFSVLLPGANREQAVTVSQKIQDALSEKFTIDNLEISIGASIGISIYPEHSTDVHGLLRYADIAMYSAKTNKTGYEVYDPDEDEYTIKRLSMINDLKEAIQNQLLDVYFQPVIDLKTKKIVSVEALCRWQHKEFGFISPEVFIELAEQFNMINPLTYMVFEKAVKIVSEWHKSKPDLGLAVNLSVYSLKDSDMLSFIDKTLKEHQFPTSNLTLEITETAMMDNLYVASEKLIELKNMGVNLSIDDFGTGYSSMAYLKKLPLDILKIDKSFIFDMDDDASNDTIAHSTINLAHDLGLQVVAEGIESAEVMSRLVDYGCDFGQGYFLSKPLPADKIKSTWLL